MAANYWNSTQRAHWFFTKDTLADIREEIQDQHARAINQYPFPDRRLIFIFLKERLHQLAKRQQFRQQCVATALVYMHRYLLSTAMQNVNLYLLVATAFYLASKTEESPHHIRLVAQEARQAWPEFVGGDMSRIGEMEFSLISEMRSQLIVWHPYRTLVELNEDGDLALTNDEIAMARSVINDSYMTDLPLTCHPHVIALVAVFLAILFAPSTSSANMSTLTQTLSSAVQPNVFSTMGGHPGMAATLQKAFKNLPGSQQSSFPSLQGLNTGNNPRDSNPATTLQPTAQILESEKVQRMISFLAESELEIDLMIDATQEIISLYEIWEQYDEKAIKDVLSRCLKGRGLDT